MSFATKVTKDTENIFIAKILCLEMLVCYVFPHISELMKYKAISFDRSHLLELTREGNAYGCTELSFSIYF